MKTIVRVAAAMTLAAGMAQAASASEFVGNWVNIDSNTGGITRIEIGTSKAFFTVHAWGKCTPEDCDWGTVSVPISLLLGDSFTAVYNFGFKVNTLTIKLISANSLHVHQFVDFTPEDGRQDFETDDYYCREGSGAPLPDLIVSAITIPKSVVVYQESPWTWVTVTVKNVGPGILQSGTLRAGLSGCTRNGQTFTTGGYFTIAYSAPLYPGQTATHSFAVGHSSSWPVGVYSLRVKVDPDDLIDEASERNNLSAALAFDVAEGRYLAGTVLYNDNPLSNYTSVPLFRAWYRDRVSGENRDDIFFWYNSQTGHYLFSGLPDSNLYLEVLFRVAGQTDRLGGNYIVSHNLDLRLLSNVETMDYGLPVEQIIHLLEPLDNGWIFADRTPWICPGLGFSWAASPDVVNYRFKLDIYRDSEHPGGYGFEASVMNMLLSDTSYKPVLPELPEFTHFELDMRGYNGIGTELAYIMRTFGTGENTGYGWDIRFKGCPACVRGDINRDCVVNFRDFAILAEDWLVDTR